MKTTLAIKMFNVATAITSSGFYSVLADGSTSLVEPQDLAKSFGGGILSLILSLLNTIIMTVAKFALSLMDLIQVIVYKFLGLGQDISNYNGFDRNNPLIKFLLNDTVVTVLRSVAILSVVLVIVFSIFSIIMGEYRKASEDTEYSVKRIWVRGLKALLGMSAFPLVFLGIVILTNAIVTSFSAVLSNNTNFTIGGQIMAPTVYSANSFRNYAKNNVRMPVYIDFVDPYDNGTASRYTKEELAAVYDEFNKQGTQIYNKFADNSFASLRDAVVYNPETHTLANNKNKYDGYEKFICTAEQYYVMADFIDYAMANNITFYYKSLTDANIDWKYVDQSIYNPETHSLTITYADVNDIYTLDKEGKNPTKYTVVYTPTEREMTTPVQDALSTLATLLSLEGETYNTTEFIENSINQIQWKTNKVKLQLSENYNTTAWTDNDEILLYEYYRYEHNSTFGSKSITDLLNGIYLDLYTIDLQYYRAYSGYYVNLGVPQLATIINGHYYNVTESGEYDDYGDPIYTLSALNKNVEILNNLSNYNATKSDDEKLGVYIPDKGGYYSPNYSETGENLVTSKLAPYLLNTIGELYTTETATLKLKLSQNYDNFTNETPFPLVDQILLYEYYSNNSELKNQYPLIDDLYNGVDFEIYNLKLKNQDEQVQAIKINGHYYKLKNSGGFDAFGNAIYSIDLSSNTTGLVINDFTEYNKTQPDDGQIGVYFELLNRYYSDAYEIVDGNAQAINPPILDAYRIAENNIDAKDISTISSNVYALTDANGFYHKVERIRATKNTKQVSWPMKFVTDLQTIYRDLNLEQLVTTGEWLSAFNSDVEQVDGKYVATFDTSLISPQGLVMSEIFLGKVVPSDGSNLGNYMFVSKYSDAELRAMMLSIMGETYYETVTQSVKYFVDTFNLLFEPLLEKIMKGENQLMVEGEITSMQLYTYKAYLASILLSSDSAQFFLDIAKGLVGMYQFNYDILLKDVDDDQFIIDLINEYADPNQYNSTGSDGKIKYLINLEDYGIDWKNYYSDELETDTSFTVYLNRKGINASNKAQLIDIPSALRNSISDALENEYISYADLVLEEIISGEFNVGIDILNLSDAQKEDIYNEDDNFKFYTNTEEDITGYTDYTPYGLVLLDGKYSLPDGYHSVTQLAPNKRNAFAEQIAIVANYLFENNIKIRYNNVVNNETAGNVTNLIDLFLTAKLDLKSQGVSEGSKNWPAYLDELKNYVLGVDLGRRDIILSHITNASLAGNEENYNSYLNNLSLYKNYLDGAYTLLTSDDHEDEIEKLLVKYNASGVDESEKVPTTIAGLKSTYGADKDISNSVDGFKKQLQNLSKFTSDMNKVIQYGTNAINNFVSEKSIENASNKEDQIKAELKYNNATIYSLQNFVSCYSNFVTNQNKVDAYKKYFITYSARMVNTESVNKNFNVVVNNNAYSLTLTMPTAKLTEYVCGAIYLNTKGFETVFVESNYMGFLDIGPNEKLPEDGKAEFTSLNKFIAGIANATVEAYYLSNFQELCDSNINNDKISVDEQRVFINKFNEINSQRGGSYVATTYSKEDVTNYPSKISGTFNDIISSYLLLDSKEYSAMSFKNIRELMLKGIVDYESQPSHTEKEDSARFLTLFDLFCSSFEYSYNPGDGTKYVTGLAKDMSAQELVKKLAGLQDKPDEMLLHLEYEHLYDKLGYDENDGDYFIICTKDEETGLYIPFLMNSGYTNNDELYGIKSADITGDTKTWIQKYGYGVAHTDYYKPITDGKDHVAVYPIIAKGVFDNNGFPTAIREDNGMISFYRSNIVVRNASDLGISEYFNSTEKVSANYNAFQSITNMFSKLFTGKTLTERAYSGRPMLKINDSIKFPIGVSTYSVSLSKEGVGMDYTFDHLNGLVMSNFYDGTLIDTFTLILAIIAMMPIIIKALFGAFGRVLDITVYYLMSPVMFATIALGKDVTNKGKTSEETPMYNTWLSTIIKKTISVFSYVVAFQFFFILVPFIREVTFITDSSIFSSVVTLSWVSVDFVNLLLRMIFMISSAYLITEAPKLFAAIMGQDDGISEGEKVRANVQAEIAEVKNTVSGQKLVNDVRFAEESIKDVAGVNAIKDAAGKVKKVGVAVTAKGAEFYLRAKGVPKETAKKATKQYKQQQYEAIDAAKKMRDERRNSAYYNFYGSLGMDTDEYKKQTESARDWLADHGKYDGGHIKGNLDKDKQKKKAQREERRQEKEQKKKDKKDKKDKN